MDALSGAPSLIVLIEDPADERYMHTSSFFLGIHWLPTSLNMRMHTHAHTKRIHEFLEKVHVILRETFSCLKHPLHSFPEQHPRKRITVWNGVLSPLFFLVHPNYTSIVS